MTSTARKIQYCWNANFEISLQIAYTQNPFENSIDFSYLSYIFHVDCTLCSVTNLHINVSDHLLTIARNHWKHLSKLNCLIKFLKKKLSTQRNDTRAFRSNLNVHKFKSKIVETTLTLFCENTEESSVLVLRHSSYCVANKFRAKIGSRTLSNWNWIAT